jgi:hypothetical protein
MASRRRLSDLLAAQNGANAGEELSKTKRLDQIVIGAELKTKHTVDGIASMARDNHGHIGAQADFTQDIEPVLLVELEVKDDHPQTVTHQTMEQVLSIGRQNGGHTMFSKIAGDTPLHRQVIVGHQDTSSMIVILNGDLMGIEMGIGQKVRGYQHCKNPPRADAIAVNPHVSKSHSAIRAIGMGHPSFARLDPVALSKPRSITGGSEKSETKRIG